ncbi:hypothetical protein D5S17_22165 [Pseudonocardiaceae bacterium YIM PH 21723]|nr:hypothetical protein D5S17_22165 [Pseudonocardiaceae bacterium YIM PH 21723]
MRKRVYWGLGIVAGLVFVPFLLVRALGWPYIDRPGEEPRRPVALVLGAGLTKPDGKPTPFLAARLDLAVDAYRRGTVRALVVSGDNGRQDYDEPSAMRAYLVEHGVPTTSVVSDYAGFDTWDSCARLTRVFGATGAVVITQDFHLPRAVMLCRAAGVDAHGLGHDSWPGHVPTTAYLYLRELPAAYKALWDAAVQRDPIFLGPHEDGVDKALAH